MSKMFVRFFFFHNTSAHFFRSRSICRGLTHAPIEFRIFAVCFTDVHALPIQWLKCDKMGRWETWPLILFRRRGPNGAAVENRIKDGRLWYGRPRSVNGVTFQPATNKRDAWQLAGVRTSLCSAEIRSLNWPFCVGQVSEWHLWFIKFKFFVFVLMLKEGSISPGLNYVETGLSKYISCYLHLDGEVTSIKGKKKPAEMYWICVLFRFIPVLFSLKIKTGESKPLTASRHHAAATQIWSGLFQFEFFKGALTLQQACKYL